MIKKLRKRLTTIFTAMTGIVLIIILGISFIYSEKQAELSSALNFLSASNNIITTVTYELEDYSNLASLESFAKKMGYLLSITVNGKSLDIDNPIDPLLFDELLNQTISLSDIDAPPINMEDGLMISYSTGQSFGAGVTISDEETLDELSDTSYDGDPALIEYAATTEPFPFTIFDSFFLSADFAYSYPTFQWNNIDYRANIINMENVNVGKDSIELVIIEDLSQENKSVIFLRIGYLSLLCVGLVLLFLVNWVLSKQIVKPTAESLKQQTEFIAAASHELRSPLAVLRTSLSAADIADTPEEALQYRSNAIAASERLGRLVNDLLLLAGSDSKKWQITSRDVDVDTLLIEINEQYLPIAKECDHHFQLDLPEKTLGTIHGDKDRIYQILHILLDNALDYSPKGSTVTLSATNKKDKLYLSVRDEGKGIPDAEKKKIFQRFYRVDKSRTNRDHFGLGLSIACELSELHNGTLSVKDAPEGGSIFTLRLDM